MGLAGACSKGGGSETSFGTVTLPTANSMTGTSVGTDDSGTGDGTASGTADTGSPTAVQVQGRVTNTTILPVSGATVTVWENASVEPATTDQLGSFTLEDVPPNLVQYLVIEAPNHYGSIFTIATATEDLSGVEVFVIEDSFITEVETLFPNFDRSTGAIAGLSNVVDAELLLYADGMQSVVADEYFSMDDNGTPVLNDNVTHWPLLPVVIFFNLAPAAPDKYTVTALHPSMACGVVHPTTPVEPAHISTVFIDCQ